MNNDNKVIVTSKDKTKQLDSLAPLLFSIPRPYNDYDDERDFNWYKKILRLNKDPKVIKVKIEVIAQKSAEKKAADKSDNREGAKN